MSTTIDQQVVEMRFDNRNFQQNISETMSTLEKFKQKLRLDGATRGLEDVNKATKGVDMSGLGKTVDAVSMKFSALQVMGVTALANITNSAVNAGKRMISALTIDPIKTGFQDYETQMNAVQTILANTASKGSTLQDVNSALDELNTYADKTIYNFTEMTRNIGTFTAAGIDLKTSVDSIQGIANLAAVSGSTSQQASTAMYQLSQALASGTVKLMDWNSVVNAGMGGQVFQDALKATSKELKTGAEAAIKAEGSFRESLKTGWLTSEVLTETLKKFTTSGANEYVAKYTGLSKEAVQAALDEAEARYGEADAIEKASEALAAKSGKNKNEIKSALQFAKTAEDAATKVKTFSQLWDVLKESAQSGWATTWKLIVGDFEQAKALLTPLATFLTNIIEKFSKARNDLLKSALGKSFANLSKKINTIIAPAKKASQTITNVKDTVKDLGDIVNKVIRGNFGNGKERFDALTKAGYNYCEVQNKVNEKLGNSFRYTKEQIAAQDKLIGAQTKTTKSTEELTKADKDRIKQVAQLTKEEAKALGYTDEQIAAFKELGDAAKKLGMPLNEFIDNLDQINGRWLIINSFKNIGTSLITVFKAIGKAWANIFPPKSLEERSNKLFDIIAAVHRFTKSLIPTEETADKLRRVFEGLFAALDIGRTLLMGPLSIAFNILKGILGVFNLDILDGIAYIGDIIVKFRNWLKSVLDFNGIFEKLVNLIKDFIKPIKDVFNKIDFSNLSTATESIKEFIGSLNINESVANSFKKIMDGLRAAFDLGKTLWSMSLVSGLKILSAVLSLFGTDLMEVGGKLADWIVSLRDGIKEHTIFIGYVDKLAKIIHTLIEGIEKCVKAFLKLEPVQRIIQSIKDAFKDLFGGIGELNIDGFVNGLKAGIDKIVSWIESLKDSENIGRDLINGIINGIRFAITKLINVLMNIGKTIINTICKVLGIHSPSTEGKNIGENIILGIIEGMLSFVTELGKSIKNIVSSMLGSLKDSGASMMSAILWGISSIFTKNPLWNIGAALFNMFSVMGGNVTDGFTEGIGSGLSSVIDCITNLASNLINAFKNMLGIHSPSRVFMTIGKFLIAGLIIGIVGQKTGLFGVISNVFGNALTSIKDMFSGVWEWMQNLPPIKWEYLLGVGILVGVVVIIKKFINIIDNFSQAAKGVGKMCSSIGSFMDALTNKMEPKTRKIDSFADAALKLAISIGILAASVWLLSNIDIKSLWNAVGAVAALSAIVAILAAIFNGLGKKMTVDIDKISGLILSVSSSMLLLAIAVKVMGSMDQNQLNSAGAVLSGILVFLAGLIMATKLGAKGGKFVDKFGILIKKIAWSMLLLAIAIKIMGSMDWPALGHAGAAIVGLGVFIAGLIWATKLAGKDIDKVGPTIFKISAAMLLLAITAKILSGMSFGEMGKAAVGLVGLSLIIKYLIKITDLATDKDIARVTSTLLAMSFCIGILGIISIVLSMISFPGLLKGVGAVAVLSTMMTLMIKATKGANDVKGNIMMIAIAIGIMAASLAVLSMLDQNALRNASYSLGLVMAIFALIIKASENAKASVGPLIVMSVVIGMLGGILYLLAGLPVDSALASAISLSIMLVALSGSLWLINKAQKPSVKALISVGVMTAVMFALATILFMLQGLPVMSALATAASLSIMILAMSASLWLLSTLQTVATKALIAIGVIMLVAIALGAMAAVLGAFDGMSWGAVGMGLTILAGSFLILSVAAYALAPVSPIVLMLGSAIALLGAGCLMAGTGVLAFTNALTMLAAMGPAGALAIQAVVMTLINLIPMVAAAIGQGIIAFANVIIQGAPTICLAITTVVLALIAALTATIPPLIQCLGLLLTELLKFIVSYVPKVVEAGMKLILGLLEGIANNIAKVVATAIQVCVEFINGVSSKIGDVIDAGIKLMISFINGLADGIRNNTDAMISAVNNLMSAVIGAIGAWFKNLFTKGGEIVDKIKEGIKNSLSKLKEVGKDMMEGLINGIKEKFGAIKDAAVNGVKSAVGKVKEFLGINSPSKLFAKLGGFSGEGFAIGMANCFKLIRDTSAKLGANAVKGVQEELDINSPSKVARDKVGKYFVQGIAEGITEDMSAEEAAAQKADNIVSAFQNEFDKLDTDVSTADLEHELWSKTSGVNASDAEINAAELDRLSKNYKIQTNRVALAQGEYDVTLKEFGKTAEETQEAYNKLLQQQIDLADLSSQISELQGATVSNTPETFNAYADYLKKNAAKLQAFGMSMEDIQAAASQASGYNPNEVTKDTTATLTEVGTTYGEAMNTGIQSTSDQTVAVTSNMVQTCASRIKELQPEWITSGSYLVEGFIKGIDDKINDAANKETEMANEEYRSAINALGIASPSKLFAKVGMYADLGFVKGLTDYADKAAEASAEMATGALSGLKSVIRRLTDTIGEDVSSKATITPVLDLSNIQNGVSQLRGLFANRSAELAASASISVNGTNNMYDYIDQMQKINDARDSEIVGALGELRGDFGNLIDAISNLGIQLDDGTMVGKIIGKIDTGLGRIANHKGRGN